MGKFTCADLSQILKDGISIYSRLEGSIVIVSPSKELRYQTSSFSNVHHWKVTEMLDEQEDAEVYAVMIRATYVPIIPKDEVELKKLENQTKLYGAPPKSAADVLFMYTTAKGMEVIDNMAVD